MRWVGGVLCLCMHMIVVRSVLGWLLYVDHCGASGYRRVFGGL